MTAPTLPYAAPDRLRCQGTLTNKWADRYCCHCIGTVEVLGKRYCLTCARKVAAK